MHQRAAARGQPDDERVVGGDADLGDRGGVAVRHRERHRHQLAGVHRDRSA